MRKLTLRIGDRTVFVYLMCSGGGGYLARVWPGGEFKGLSFERLLSLGTGEHELDLDEHLPVRKGTEPQYESEWERQVQQQFRYELFKYHVGASTDFEVLNSARGVIRLESEFRPT